MKKMNSSFRISRLTRPDKPRFVALMSEAFSRDPLFLYVFGDSELDERAGSNAAAFVSFIFDMSFMLHEEAWGLFENDTLLGAYVVEKPGASKLQRVGGGLRLIGRMLPLFLRLPRNTLRLLNSYMRATRSSAPPWAHHYLVMIGVRPDRQGKGVGTALLNHLLNTVHTDPNSRGVALDTENEDNVNLYRRFGFALGGEWKLGSLPVYCMSYRKDDSLFLQPRK